ncbi:zinc metallopeptidase [Paludisphaera mucosa]|uniref:Zinc metallopeptidase n=1 Tax=Paludisphaera mucosa TaxID=3030827 RepID=A0ABT6FGY2_9BACT|nr:zinc metallopeptidase [Paludisphaera mucosa]MDG3006825.1 zinc metallopeptidase [Paludisphaera mucosa]
MFFGADPLYLLLVMPALALAGWAQTRIVTAYREGSRYRASSGVTGAQAAEMVMREGGVQGVTIEPVAGQLTDHYDPSHKVLRLSSGNFQEDSLAAVGVAAHEAGHAIQDATHYPLLVVRNLMVPLAGLGSNASMMLLIGGVALQWPALMYIAIGLFSLAVLFQVVNLPVEFNASRRARTMLQQSGLISPEEDVVVGKVLNAAAMTYVAATLTGVSQLVYFLIRSGAVGRGSRDDDRTA